MIAGEIGKRDGRFQGSRIYQAGDVFIIRVMLRGVRSATLYNKVFATQPSDEEVTYMACHRLEIPSSFRSDGEICD